MIFMRRTGKRALSVILSCIIAFGCVTLLSGTLLTAHAATAGSYKWRVRVHSNNNTGGWDADKLTVYGKSNNGTGSEGEIYSHSNWYIDFKGDRDNTFGDGDQTTTQFPTKLTYFYQFGGGITHRKMDAYIYLDLYYDDEWHEIGSVQCYSYEWGQNKGTKTLTIDSSKYPEATSITALTGGDSTLNVPTDGTSTNYTNAFSAGTVKDQYGVNWYQDASLSASSHTGVSFANNKLSVNSNGNAKNDYDITITETCGSATNSTTVNIKTFDYKVTFYDEDGTSVLKSVQTVDYGNSAETPPNPTKQPDADNHYDFAGWTGDGYENLTSGKQTRSVKASYSALGHNWDYAHAVYTWSQDYSACTATITCTRNPQHTKTVNATVTSAVTTESTCNVDGEKTYTATFSDYYSDLC